jgi:hypothetical protein
MKTDRKAKTKSAGMSSRDFQANLGLNVTPRQFRRYVKARLIPEKWIKKNARGHFTFHPPANAKWSAMRERIEQWRQLRYQRGWSLRPQVIKSLRRNKVHAFVSIEGLSQKFDMWLRRMWPEIVEMDENSLLEIGIHLSPIASLSWWIERKFNLTQEMERVREEQWRDFI